MTATSTPGGGRRRFTDHQDQDPSRIGADVTLTGDLKGKGDLVVEGNLHGNLELDGLLWLRPDGHIEGDVTAVDIVIEGQVVGDLRASRKIELRTTCRVQGDLIAPGLAIAEGGHFEGNITMAGRISDREAVSFTEKREPEP